MWRTDNTIKKTDVGLLRLRAEGPPRDRHTIETFSALIFKAHINSP